MNIRVSIPQPELSAIPPDLPDDRIDGARMICEDLLNGKSEKETTHYDVPLDAWGVGTMIAHMVEKNIIESPEDAFSVLERDRAPEDVWSSRKVAPDRILNRDEAIATLIDASVIPANVSMRTIKPSSSRPTADHVLDIVQEITGVPRSEIASGTRRAAVICARYIAILVMRDVCGQTLSQIGERIGNRNHTSVLNGLNQIRIKCRQNAGIRETAALAARRADAAGIRNRYEMSRRVGKTIKRIA